MDEKQFVEEVVEGCNNLVYKIAGKFKIPNYSKEDLYQICMTELWENRKNYNPKYKITTWVHTISKRKLIKVSRKENRMKRGGDKEKISLHKEIKGTEGLRFEDLIEDEYSKLEFKNRLSYLFYQALREDLMNKKIKKQKTKEKIIDLIDLLWYNIKEAEEQVTASEIKKEIAEYYGDSVQSVDWLIRNRIIPVVEKYL